MISKLYATKSIQGVEGEEFVLLIGCSGWAVLKRKFEKIFKGGETVEFLEKEYSRKGEQLE